MSTESNPTAVVSGDSRSLSVSPSSVRGSSVTVNNDASARVYYWIGTGNAPGGVPSWGANTGGHNVPIVRDSTLSMNTEGAGKPGLTTLEMTKTGEDEVP